MQITLPFPETVSLAERRVAELAASTCLSDKELANTLGLATRTVKAHLQSVYRKMGWGGFGSRIKLVKWCLSRENGSDGAKQN